ncbi:phage holin, lambda family [Pseudomonas sp.]|uniref:phage holin, lambda family n=1 Tax=Pseudomonas sp. TaxID=306 RepID=UPI003F3DD393
MPDRTPFIELLGLISEPYRAALLGALVALLRVLYDGKEPRWARRILEAALCGLIALGIAHLVQALGLSSGWATFFGGAVGLFGADQVREWGRRMAEERVK